MFRRSVFVFVSLTLTACTFITSRVLAQQPSVHKHRPSVTSPSPQTAPPTEPDMPRDKVSTRSSWSFLSLQAADIETFLHDHPTFDGRGVTIVILDTGVDPDLDGLKQTSDGKVKIVDVQNYSGTGDVPFIDATRDHDRLLVNGTEVLHGLNAIAPAPIDGKYYYAHLDERDYRNGLGDINLDGKENDHFGILLFQDQPGHYVAYVDSDGNHDLTGEHKLTNYHESFSTFDFHGADSTGRTGTRLGGAVNIDPEHRIVSVYFDDGSHGTHVAGIAAGYEIDGAKGFNGVAPGAQVVGIKFADDNAGGITVPGSMKRGFEYAAALARTGKPVVVNMSFGIGSALEGSSVMDKWLDSLLEESPELAVCISAGNEGPGLSSIGLPGSADRVITSGAALPDDAARDLYASKMSEPIIWGFSSRGGELAKPDIVSPGTAVSTVPDYVSSPRYNGTSMSSPYTTGCVALLMSSMTQAFPGYRPNAFAIKRALMLTAVPLADATPLDQGFGMVNVPRAFELLSTWERSHYTPPHYTIETKLAGSVSHGSAEYFRGGLNAFDDTRGAFEITEDDHDEESPRESSVGFHAFDLRSDATWLKPIQSSTYRRGAGSFSVSVDYDRSQLTLPGLYSARVWGYPKGKHNRESAQFELLNSVIVPYEFSAQNNYAVSVTPTLPKHLPARMFFKIPAGTREVRLTLSGPAGATGMAQLFDNDGNQFQQLYLKKSSIPEPASLDLTGETLPMGVWEIDLSNGRSLDEASGQPVTVQLEVVPLDVYIVSARVASDGLATANFSVTNGSSESLSLQNDAEIIGYERYFDTTIDHGDEFMMPLYPNVGESNAEIQLTLSREDYDQFTDLVAQVLSPDSSAATTAVFQTRSATAVVELSDTLQLHFRGGRADPEHAAPFTLHIRERRILKSPFGATVAPAVKELAPEQTEAFELAASRSLPAIPAGFQYYGKIRMKRGKSAAIDLPIHF